MSALPVTPDILREQAKNIRHSAQYAQGSTRTEELDQAQQLERQADKMEQELNEGNQ